MSVTRVLPVDEMTKHDDTKNEIFNDLHVMQIGTIESYNNSLGTCTVQIRMKLKTPQGNITDVPLLTDVPIFVLQGGGASIEFPITKGDKCLVIFNDRDIDVYWATENYTLPNTIRKHNFSDAFALVGFNSKINPLGLLNVARIFSGSHKFDIANTTGKLSLILSDFFDAVIGAIQTDGSTMNPATIATMQAIKTRLSNLLGGD